MFRGISLAVSRHLIFSSLFCLLPAFALAQHHGGHGVTIGSTPGRPTGVEENDTLKDFHQTLAVQATGQQVAEFEQVIKRTNAAKDALDSLSPVSAGRPVPIASLDQALDAARSATQQFQAGMSEKQKSGLKDQTKRLDKADSSVAEAQKHLDESVRSGAPASEIAAGIDGVGRLLSELSNAQLSLGREMSIVLAQSQDLTFALSPSKIPVHIGDHDLVVASSGELTQTDRKGETRTFSLRKTIDLSDLQQNIAPVLEAQFDQAKTCGERLAVRQAVITSAPPASSLLLRLHYERWSCGGLSAPSGAQELAESDGTAELSLSALVEQSRLKIQSEFRRIDASGMMAEALRSGDLGQDVRGKVSQTLLSALGAGADPGSLPKVLENHVVVQSARFQDAGSGLKLVLEGEVKLSNDQVTALANQLNQTLSAQQSAAP